MGAMVCLFTHGGSPLGERVAPHTARADKRKFWRADKRTMVYRIPCMSSSRIVAVRLPALGTLVRLWGCRPKRPVDTKFRRQVAASRTQRLDRAPFASLYHRKSARQTAVRISQRHQSRSLSCRVLFDRKRI